MTRVLTEQWWRTVYSASRIWVDAPQVIALRSARMLAGGFAPRADDRRELARMVHEKTAAAGESATAVAVQLWKTNWELAMMPLRWWWGMWAGAARWKPFVPASGPLLLMTPAAGQKQLAAAASRIVHSSLEPVRRRVTANAKRLRRRKPR
jgi:hypothetical protein